MKKIFFAIVLANAMFTSCKPDLKGELGDPADKVAGIHGSWQVTTFVQQDPNNPIKEERDLSEFYIVDGETPYQLSFDKDTRTYTVNVGPGKNYFGTGGTWAFDNEQFPTYLYLYSPTDTIETLLGNVVRPSDSNLNIELENSCTDAEGVKTTTSIYKFSLIRVS